MTEEIKVKITLPENVTEVIKQQKINTLYDLLNKSSNSSEKNINYKKISWFFLNLLKIRADYAILYLYAKSAFKEIKFGGRFYENKI